MTTSLPTTRLGWTDMLLTRAGFGAWAIAGGGWAYAPGSQDDTESWLPGATLELKTDDLADIAAAVRATGAGTGPDAPAATAGQ